MSLHFSFRSVPNPEKSADGAPFRIVVLGDFGGHAPALEAERQRHPGPWRIDCDNFEEVFARAGVRLDLPPGNEGDREIKLRFQQLDDFHPDRLIKESEPLARLAGLLRRASSVIF